MQLLKLRSIQGFILFSSILIIFILFGCGTGQTVVKGTHITKIQTGTGYDQRNATVEGETGTFMVGQTLYIVFTVDTQDKNAQVTLKLFQGNTLDDTSVPLSVQSGTHVYSKSISLNSTGSYNIEIDYNGKSEASINFKVT